ncbi:XRE family transcriptional regulator [Mesorhizobium sp. M2A.F.Ca.ET.039.01.1.1]|uniref:XRE family transcriptional regulator n=1 Tax=Mesorhizobium sp. M2A.F.Ca.ET.039.01.1.1 TaxID=2496746 RepID=UPI001FE09B2A|nr:XRE family transcriptional regulator [Mesorhizobium sp. M2A.F.Ca.ET.039.01.1.1]
MAARVEALGKSAITLARSVGLERGFINDILIDRKKSVRDDEAGLLLAKSLECDFEYLTGQQSEVRRLDPNAVEFGGICETGVWRTDAAGFFPARTTAPIEPDPRYPGMPNIAFDVRGDGLGAEGILDGMTVTGIKAEAWIEAFGPPRAGLIAVCRARRDGSESPAIELSLRKTYVWQGATMLTAAPADPRHHFEPLTLGSEGVEILAIVTRAVRLFLDLETPLTTP